MLWELLTGKCLFGGETVSHTLADVLRGDIDLNTLPKGTPQVIRNLLRRCLDRDLKNRLRDIGEARIVLENPKAGAPEEMAKERGSRPLLPRIAATLLLITAAALSFVHFGEAPREDLAHRQPRRGRGARQSRSFNGHPGVRR